MPIGSACAAWVLAQSSVKHPSCVEPATTKLVTVCRLH
ncbi:UNVERIFIED_CONTAM: hypothetical protein GTU68_015765 [Idotea baltica]|nr:hypothetical protein [Idotea baltica]